MEPAAVGAAAGIVNGISAGAGGILAGWLVGLLHGSTGSYLPGFAVLGALGALGGLSLAVYGRLARPVAPVAPIAAHAELQSHARPGGNVIAPLEHASVGQQVYERLSHLIFSGELRQGQRLDVARLASSLGVSTQPVKAALGRLNLERVVDVRPRSGTFVRVISLPEARELLRVRLMMETFAVDEAAGLDSETEHAMAQAIAGMQRVLGERPFDWVRYNACDVEFHQRLVGLAGNRILSAQYGQLHCLHATGRYWISREDKTRRDHPDHERILAALRHGDRAAARGHIARHIGSSVTILDEQRVRQEGEPACASPT